MNLVNIVATHAYIDDHSGIVPHTCSATSMCALRTQVRVQLVWKILYMCVAMDTGIICVLPWILRHTGELVVIFWVFHPASVGQSKEEMWHHAVIKINLWVGKNYDDKISGRVLNSCGAYYLHVHLLLYSAVVVISVYVWIGICDISLRLQQVTYRNLH